MNFKILDKLKKIRESLLWQNSIRFFLQPIYDLFWKYIINFQGRIFFIFFYSYKKIDKNFDLNLIKNDKIIIYDDTGFKNIANVIFENIKKKHLIKNSYEKLNLGNYTSGDNKYKSGLNAYVDDLFDLLDDQIKEEIVKFAINHKVYLSASKYLGVLPVIAKINVMHNIENKSKTPRASMLWHKDDFGYKSLDLFLAISDINKDNGPLEFVKKKNPLGIFYKIKSNLDNPKPGQRNKIQNSQFSEYFKDNDIDRLIGKSGTGLLIDSFSVYHRGGNCNLTNRIVLRISYQTPDSYTLSKINKNTFSQYLTNNKIDNFINKYSLTKRYIFDYSKYLLKFYRIFHYRA